MDINDQDLYSLKDFYGSHFEINTFKDIYNAQRHTLDKIPHSFIEDASEKLLTVEKIVERKDGSCYHRSFLLQKLMIANGLKVKPIYLFYGKNNTRLFYFFRKNLMSHAIFKVEFNNQWVIIETNEKMDEQPILSFKQYLDADFGVVPNHSLFIPHVASRHGKFIGPVYFPDFY